MAVIVNKCLRVEKSDLLIISITQTLPKIKRNHSFFFFFAPVDAVLIALIFKIHIWAPTSDQDDQSHPPSFITE
jgi:hypothetical protein